VSKARVNVAELAARLPLGEGHERQEHAVAAALRSILGEGRRGVVLADEVGFGKTYEALAVMALLCDQATKRGKTFGHVLVLCKRSLLPKWLEEVSVARAGRGFPQYIRGPYWDDHPVHDLLKRVHVVERRWSADELRAGGLRGHRRDGRIQVPNGLYIVNHDLLSAKARASRLLLGQIWRTRWDLIIVDEAHHYAHLNKPAFIFAPDGNLRNYDQGIGDGRFRHVLALTATPFELTPGEMVNLLALVRADPADLDVIEKGLDLYVTHLDRFFSLRQWSPHDPLRAGEVRRLQSLRDGDALGQGGQGQGLQELLRRYVIRNTKSQNERRYFLVNKVGDAYEQQQFDKLDDLHDRIRRAALLPFDGPDALFYLELRGLIQETVEQAREGTGRRTFISTDLRQGLSSYRQIAASKLLDTRKDQAGAQRLAAMLKEWNSPTSLRLHPKVRALVELVQTIAQVEVDKVRTQPRTWFSKVLVFNKLIQGTAPQLREELNKNLAPVFEDFLGELVGQQRLETVEAMQTRFRDRTRREVQRARQAMLDSYGERCLVPAEFRHEDLREFAGRPLLDAYGEVLSLRCKQPLFLLRAVLNGGGASDEAVGSWVAQNLVVPVEAGLHSIIDQFLGQEARAGERDPLELAEQEAVFLLEECRSVELVGRYDGANTRDREAHRRNFNNFYNPFVLLVSRVGEEGIDLQEQCRYVVHYDLEWNQAKMEQREGRVDRVGWGRADEKFIDVRFMLLKGTYEERIFHTLMQRDQWFQILIGSKRKEMGEIKPEEEEDSEAPGSEGNGDQIEDAQDRGRLTSKEKEAVMLDLRPCSGKAIARVDTVNTG